MAEAREQRLRVSGNPSQYGNLQRFVEEQTLFRKIIRHSKLPWIEIDVSDNNVLRAVDSIAEWMNSVGGLRAKEEPTTP
jgi:regulator of PEP synthase PpsR (kinase-PPPase family)